MESWYLDTSAAAKLFIDEPETRALAAAITESKPELCSSALLEAELRRVAHRNPEVPLSEVTRLLSSIVIYELDMIVYRQAGLLPGPDLRSLDAIHLACAITLNAKYLVTYDKRLLSAAADLGIPTLAPGAVD